MATADPKLDIRNFPAAALDSRGILAALLGDLLERPPIPIERRFLAGQLLPALDDHIDVLRIQLDAVADALGYLRGSECGPAAKKRLVNQLATLGVVQDRPPHQLNRLLRRVIKFRFFRSAHDELRRRRIPDRRVLAGFAEPGCVLLSNVPARLVLEPVMGSRKDRPTLVPDYLLMMKEPDPQQAVQNLARECAGVPNVGHLETRNESIGIGPISPRVAGNRGLGMTGGALLHVARLGGAATIESRSIAPLGIQFDTVRRVGDHQARLALAKQPRDIVR